MIKPLKKFFNIDVMIGDKFFHTFRVSILLADRISNNGKPVFSVEKVCKHIESRMPELKQKKYTIYPG